METTVFEIELTDGRIYRIFCGNSTQTNRLLTSLDKIKHICKSSKVITKGIHTVTEWENIITHL